MRLHEVMWPIEYMLTLVGLWPSTTSSVGFFIYLRFIVGLFALASFFVAQFMTVAVNWGDISVLGDYGALSLVHFLVCLKILYFFLRRRSFGEMYLHIKDFWNISDDPQERRHYERLANVAKVVAITSFIAGIGDLLSFEAVALMNLMKNRHEVNESLRHRPLPMELFYGFDTQRTPVYELLFVWQNISMFYAICSVIGCDNTIMVFTVHVTGQFKLIAARFRAVGRKINEETVAKDELRAEIGKLIAHHQHTIKVTEELNALTSPVIFGQIVTSGLEICLSGYAVIKGDSSAAEIIKFFVLFVSLLIQLIVFCAPAELLIQDSTNIAEAIYYEVPWFKLTPSIRRDLCFVMMRAQKACHVTALYQVMSIRRITEVFNAAGSYLALLNSMKK